MMLKELILQGWQALMRNRMRSILTMMGITWGLVSVVILLAYGQGLGGGVLAAFSSLGNDVIVLWPGQTSMQAGGQRAGKKIKYDGATGQVTDVRILGTYFARRAIGRCIEAAVRDVPAPPFRLQRWTTDYSFMLR